MAYPRQLELDEEVKAALIAQIDQWILDHRQERGEWEDQLLNWQEDYNAEPLDEQKDFPFQDSCKIIIPLTAIAVETNHAAAMGTIFPSGGQIVSFKGKSPDAQRVAPIFQRFVNDQLDNHVKLRRGLESAVLEIEKFGTGVAKAEYCKVTKYGVREEGGVEVEFPVIVKNNVEVQSVPIARFWQPFHELDPQFSSWTGELHELTPAQVKQMAADGKFREDAFEMLEGHFTQSTDDQDDNFQSNQEELEKREPSMPTSIKIFEIWCEYDVEDLDGSVPKEIQLFYCEDIKDIVGISYNQNPNLRRPYRSGVYIRVEHRWAGIGICKQNEQFQIEVTVQHRQRIDNATIANIRMFKIAKMSGYGPNEPIFPGKMWFLDDMNDIEPMQLGEIYPSAYNNEQQTLLYSQQRVGVNENTLGMPQVGTPGTATADMARLQEAKRKFDYVIGNIKDFALDVVFDVMDLMKQYGTRNSYLTSNPTEAQIVTAIMGMPFASFREGQLFNIALIGAQTNKVLDRQNWTQVSQYLTQYYTQMLQLAMNTQNPQLIQMFTQKALVGGTEAMRQVLETFDIQNIDSILPVQELLNGVDGNTLGGGNLGASGNLALGGMGSPAGLPSQTAPQSNGVVG